MDNIFLLPAALFPAIPLMMINFGNRYITLATLIRKIHDELMAKKLTKKDKESNIYLKQITKSIPPPLPAKISIPPI